MSVVGRASQLSQPSRSAAVNEEDEEQQSSTEEEETRLGDLKLSTAAPVNSNKDP